MIKKKFRFGAVFVDFLVRNHEYLANVRQIFEILLNFFTKIHALTFSIMMLYNMVIKHRLVIC